MGTKIKQKMESSVKLVLVLMLFSQATPAFYKLSDFQKKLFKFNYMDPGKPPNPKNHTQTPQIDPKRPKTPQNRPN